MNYRLIISYEITGEVVMQPFEEAEYADNIIGIFSFFKRLHDYFSGNLIADNQTIVHSDSFLPVSPLGQRS